MSQEPDKRVPTPVAHQIEHVRRTMAEKPPGSMGRAICELVISNLEMVLDDERDALMLVHATARGQEEVDPIAILWFTKVFLPYVKQ